MSLRESLERILKDKKLSKTDLAERMGAKPQSIQAWLARDNPTLETLQKMATALDVTVSDLLGEDLPLKRKEGYVYIPILDVTLSAGNGTENRPVAIEDHFVRKLEDFRLDFPGVNPDNVRIVTVRGDSMSPTFLSKDLVLVDISDTMVRDAIFALTLEGDQYIKRLQRFPGGKILVVSDNPKYAPIELNQYSQAKIEGHVIGAVLVRRV